MASYLLRRLILAIPVLIGILALTFALGRLVPGDPCTAMLGEKATPQICNAFIKRMGLDQPLPNQFAIYLSNILHGDLGDSVRYGRPVTDLLAERLPVTFELTIAATIFAVSLGIPLGIIAAYRYNSSFDVATMVGANIGVSMPVFWLGLMLAYLFGVILKGTPLALPSAGQLTPGADPTPFYVAWGMLKAGDTPTNFMTFIAHLNSLNALLTLNWGLLGDTLQHLILPCIAVGTIPLAIIARMTRASVLETLSLDYVRMARAKGLRERAVVLVHALRNALLPVVTIIGLNFGALLAGAVLTETVFGFSGIGKTLFDGITARDYSLVQGITLITAIAFVFINLLVDVLYSFLDPRIRLG